MTVSDFRLSKMRDDARRSDSPHIEQIASEDLVEIITRLEKAEQNVTIRDTFAIAAIPSFISITHTSGTVAMQEAMKKAGVDNPQELIALQSYAIADAMMARRDK